MIKMVTIMKTKKQYISPLTLEQVLNYSTVLCASGGGGDMKIILPGVSPTIPSGGDPADAF